MMKLDFLQSLQTLSQVPPKMWFVFTGNGKWPVHKASAPSDKLAVK